MVQEQPSSGPAVPEPSLPWYQVWLKALTEPRVATYESLVSRPGVSLGKACLWVAVAGGLGIGISVGLAFAFRGLTPFGAALRQSAEPVRSMVGAGVFLVCLIPVAAVLSAVGLLIGTGISHVLARALGGVGTYAQLAYAFAAYTAPASLINAAVSFIPCVGAIISIPLAFYLLFLNILAIKSVHHISWGRAVVSSVLFVALLLTILACGVIIVLALLGPAIGNVFSNIVGEI